MLDRQLWITGGTRRCTLYGYQYPGFPDVALLDGFLIVHSPFTIFSFFKMHFLVLRLRLFIAVRNQLSFDTYFLCKILDVIHVLVLKYIEHICWSSDTQVPGPPVSVQMLSVQSVSQ